MPPLSNPPQTESVVVSNSTSSSKHNWWQSSIVRRTVSFVANDLERLFANAPFLHDVAADTSIALFHRSEIETGRILGKGGFSVVRAVAAFHLDDTVTARLTPAERTLREQCVRNCTTASGESRYAVKHLQSRLLKNPKDFHFAASDLAVEAAYLSRLDHPNILQAQGLPIDGIQALSDGKHDGFFILMDRLEDTLDHRIQQWKEEQILAPQAQHEPPQRLSYALQIASALEYMHSKGIMFRDLKPHNIGFTSGTDTVQLLDFGLVRELPNPAAAVNDTFEMSGVGTRRYMAVEIINDSRYNCKIDVFSWSMVVWEMLSLTKPYAAYSVEEHKEYVCEGGERPALDANWSNSLQNLFQQAWTTDISERFTMERVCNELRAVIFRDKIQIAPGSPISAMEDTSLVKALVLQKEDLTRPTPVFLNLPSFRKEVDDDNERELKISPTRSISVSLSSHWSEALDVSSTSVWDLALTSLEGIEVVVDAALERRVRTV